MLGKVLEVREMGKSALKAIDVEQSPRPPGAWPFFEGCYVMRLRPWQVRSWGQGAPWAVPRSLDPVRWEKYLLGQVKAVIFCFMGKKLLEIHPMEAKRHKNVLDELQSEEKCITYF